MTYSLSEMLAYKIQDALTDLIDSRGDEFSTWSGGKIPFASLHGILVDGLAECLEEIPDGQSALVGTTEVFPKPASKQA